MSFEFLEICFVSCAIHLIYLIVEAFDGEGSGNPLQYSCLENPRDGGAWCRLWGGTESDTTEVT